MTRRSAVDDLPPPPPETWRQRLTYWQYRSVWAVAAGLPDRLARRLPERIGGAWYAAAPSKQRQQVARNLARVAPHVTGQRRAALVRAAYVSYARYWLDSFRLHTRSGEEISAAVRTEGLPYAEGLLADGSGGIFATGHLGSWDVGAYFAAERGWVMTTVAEVVEPRRLFERFVRLREDVGIEVIPLVRGGNMLDRLQARMRDAGAMATLLADRDLGRSGPIVEFFGEPCRLPAGAVALAHRTGRPAVVGAFLTDGDDYLGVVRPPVRLDDLSLYDGVQLVAHELEALIRRAPEQWHVFVPNWLADREPRHAVAAEWRRGGPWRRLAREAYQRRRRRSAQRRAGGQPASSAGE